MSTPSSSSSSFCEKDTTLNKGGLRALSSSPPVSRGPRAATAIVIPFKLTITMVLSTINQLLWLCLLYLGRPTTVDAFVVQPFSLSLRLSTNHPSLALHGTIDPFSITSMETMDVMSPASTSTMILAGIGDILQTVAIVVTVIVFALAGLTYLTASVLIPKAAEQLEREASELDPDALQRTLAELNEGETLAMRPDLMQKLGTEIQPLLDAKMARLAAGGSTPAPKNTENEPNTLDVVEAEIMQDSDDQPPNQR